MMRTTEIGRASCDLTVPLPDHIRDVRFIDSHRRHASSENQTTRPQNSGRICWLVRLDRILKATG